MRPLPWCRFLSIPLALLLLAGCAPALPRGAWLTDPHVARLFLSGTVLPNHTYYYLGSFGAPDSIIAIDNRFTLRSRVCALVHLHRRSLHGWHPSHRTAHLRAGCEFRGGLILTPDGRRAGVWYSQNIINTVRLPEPGVIEVFQPHSPTGDTCGRNDDGALFDLD